MQAPDLPHHRLGNTVRRMYVFLLKIFLARFTRSVFTITVGNFFKFQLCSLCSYFYLRRALRDAYCIGIKDSEIYKLAFLISASKDQIGHFHDFLNNYLFRSIQNYSIFSTTTTKRIWVLFWDICHLFWDNGYLSKHYFGIFEKNNSGIRDIWGRLLWDIGYWVPP